MMEWTIQELAKAIRLGDMGAAEMALDRLGGELANALAPTCPECDALLTDDGKPADGAELIATGRAAADAILRRRAV